MPPPAISSATAAANKEQVYSTPVGIKNLPRWTLKIATNITMQIKKAPNRVKSPSISSSPPANSPPPGQRGPQPSGGQAELAGEQRRRTRKPVATPPAKKLLAAMADKDYPQGDP